MITETQDHPAGAAERPAPSFDQMTNHPATAALTDEQTERLIGEYMRRKMEPLKRAANGAHCCLRVALDRYDWARTRLEFMAYVQSYPIQCAATAEGAVADLCQAIGTPGARAAELRAQARALEQQAARLEAANVP